MERVEDAGPEARFDARAALDPYYAPLVEAGWSRAALVSAGFFDDGLDCRASSLPTANPRWMCTPLPRLGAEPPGGEGGKRNVVLLSTGSFSPVHQGHIAMMTGARAALQAQGYNVVGGYMSPSHDAYVSTKLGGTAALSAPHRIQLLERALQLHPWLQVDPWEALHVDLAVNFTDVVTRLETYLAYHWPHSRIEVAYVFGADNAAFRHAFRQQGLAVCMSRPGHGLDVTARVGWPADAQAGHNVVHASSGLDKDISSRLVRRGTTSPIQAIQEDWTRWRSPGQAGNPPSCPAPASTLLLRDDLESALAHWRGRGHDSELAAARTRLGHDIRDAMVAAFASAQSPDQPVVMELEVCNPSAQGARLGLISKGRRVLSLDVHTGGDAGLGVSRLFELAGPQWSPLGYVARPGWPPLAQQVDAIQSGQWLLLDDDSSTGGTMRAVRALLPDRVEVTGQVTLHDNRELVGDSAQGAHLDILDMRDFVPGALWGGLVVGLPDGCLARAPYVAPYVSLRARASFPPSTELSASLAIWQANTRFFAALPNCLRVHDADASFVPLALAAGFDMDTSLVQVCQWHAGLLEQGMARRVEPEVHEDTAATMHDGRMMTATIWL